MEEVRLRSSDFRRERVTQWVELESLVDRIEKKGLSSLPSRSIQRLPALYRAAVSSLSVARSISLDRNMLEYLESLVARAFVCVYGVKPRTGGTIREFFSRSFPAAVRHCGAGIIASLGLLLAGIVVGLATYSPVNYDTIMPDGMSQGRTPLSSTEDLREILYSGSGSSDSELGLFSTFLFTHNAQIGFFAFAIGFALGLPTIIILFYNGLLLGAMAGLYASRGLGAEFWAWVLPHGVTELLAVCLCGGAGLQIALAIVRPGRHRRLDNLARSGRQAALVVLGAALLFLAAGLIEGYFRQLVQDVPTRFIVAGATFLFWTAYLGLRRPRERRP